MYKTIAKLIGNTERTIFAWKKEQRPIINLLEKYFTKEELKEFLETGSIERIDNQSFIDNFYNEQAHEFLSIIYEMHYKSKSEIFPLFVKLLSDDIKHIEDIEMYWLELHRRDILSSQTLINSIKNSPIPEQLFMYIKINIENNWEPLNKYIIQQQDDFMWLSDYIKLITLVGSKNMFYDIFAFANGKRKIPNIPNPDKQSHKDAKITSEHYCKIIKTLIEKIKNNTWDDDLFIDIDSKPFSHKDEIFEKWMK